MNIIHYKLPQSGIIIVNTIHLVNMIHRSIMPEIEMFYGRIVSWKNTLPKEIFTGQIV